mgnify:CR=1 FL=1
MNAQILIKTTNDWFEFTKSKTGQLDYVGRWDNNNKPDVDGAQKFTSSTFFTPSYYVYVDSTLNFNPVVYVAPDVDVSDKDVFDYLVHIGPLLAAVEAKDTLLAGELYLRRPFACFIGHLSSSCVPPASPSPWQAPPRDCPCRRPRGGTAASPRGRSRG